MPGHVTVSQVPDYSSCVPHIISVASVEPWIAPRPHGARPARGRGPGGGGRQSVCSACGGEGSRLTGRERRVGSQSQAAGLT